MEIDWRRWSKQGGAASCVARFACQGMPELQISRFDGSGESDAAGFG